MKAIYHKEIKRFYNSLLGYVFLCVFLFFCGYYFVSGCLLAQRADIGGFFKNLIVSSIFLVPVVTMRLLSEERKLGTEIIFMTAPVSLSSVVFGKFLSAISLFGFGLLFTLPYIIILKVYSRISMIFIIGCYIGFLLVLSMFIAIGLFISALTESQMIAAIISYASFYGIWLFGTRYSQINSVSLQTIVKYISVYSSFSELAIGILNPATLVFYLSVTLTFLVLTIAVYEKRRWS